MRKEEQIFPIFKPHNRLFDHKGTTFNTNAYKQTKWIHQAMHMNIHTYIYTYIHKYTHESIHTCLCTCVCMTILIKKIRVNLKGNGEEEHQRSWKRKRRMKRM